MSLSERHPYYVNYLCDIIWSQNSKLPTIQHVENAWNMLLEEEKSDANVEISQLSMVQKKVLKYIANCSSDNLSSASAVGIMGVGASSISAAISVLLAKDIIEKEEHKYFIINPVVHQLMKEQSAIE
jgi:DNA-binding MarR family transcriptional regulator